MKPALWRVPSYSEPGLPRPRTTLVSLTFLASLLGGSLGLLAFLAFLGSFLRFAFLILLRADHFRLGRGTLFRRRDLLEDRRRHHRGDGAVGFRQDLGALHLEIAHVERVADREVAHVDLELRGDVGRETLHLHLAEQMLEDAAAVLDAGRHADQHDPDLYRDALRQRDMLQIQVQDDAGHRIALDLADQRLHVLGAPALELEIHDDVAAVRGIQHRAEVLQGDRERDRVLATAVVDPRDAAARAKLAGHALPRVGPGGGFQSNDGHRVPSFL